MATWQFHAVRNWKKAHRKQRIHLEQQLIIGKLPAEWQVREAFRELIQLSPIMEVIAAILEVRKFDKRFKS